MLTVDRHKRVTHTTAATFLAVAMGCGSVTDSSNPFADGGATDGAGQSSGSTDPGVVPTGPVDDTGTPASSSAGDSPLVLDVGGPAGEADGESKGCRAIDFLFVVDNSGSMAAQQERLLNSFPGFISGIENSLDMVDSYHVGVITSDAYAGNEPGCTALGDLVTQKADFQSSEVCGPFAAGGRFATDQDDLPAVFPCMARVGVNGSAYEQPVTATIAALDPAKAAPGGCNEGFLRDDAILVVVIVTDDPPSIIDVDDAHPDTNTSGWYDAVVAAKGGDVESIVVIGFIPWMNVACNTQNAESPNLIEFVDAFGQQGVVASVCDENYGPVFESTIATIQTTCENFEPEG